MLYGQCLNCFIPDDIPTGATYIVNRMSRKIIRMYSALYFDEPFTASMMMLNNVCNVCRSDDREDDLNHVDIRFTDMQGIHTVDVKSLTPAFYNSADGMYYDVVTVGRKALYADTEFISIVYGNRVNIIRLSDLRNVQPLSVKMNDSGCDSKKEDLYRYDMAVLSMYDTYYIDIPPLMAGLYTRFMERYMYYDGLAYEYMCSSYKYPVKMKKLIEVIDAYRLELLDFISQINKYIAQWCSTGVVTGGSALPVETKKMFDEFDCYLAAIGV